jgi:hypothetical protein
MKSQVAILLPDTFAARLDAIKWAIHDAHKAIESEIANTPEQSKSRLRFLRSISRQAEQTWIRCEDYGAALGAIDGQEIRDME